MSYLLQRIVFKISEAAKNWTIVKNKFLVPAKPKRPLTAYIIFSNEQRSAHKGSITQVATKLGAAWKALTPEQKQKYVDEAKKNFELHKISSAEYESKYVEPFKSINSATLAVKELYQNATEKPKGIEEGASKIKAYFQTQTKQQKQKFEAEANKIKEEKVKIQEKFLIPEAEFKTEKSFIDHTLRHSNKVSFSLLPESEQIKVKKEYEKYFEKHNKTLEAFAKKHGLKLEELTEIIKLHQKRLKREESSESTVNQLGLPPKVSPLRRVRTAIKKTPVRKTATRTKVTKKAVPKKTAAKKVTSKKTAAKKTTGRKVANKN